jgi:hypothetical protein
LKKVLAILVERSIFGSVPIFNLIIDSSAKKRFNFLFNFYENISRVAQLGYEFKLSSLEH